MNPRTDTKHLIARQIATFNGVSRTAYINNPKLRASLETLAENIIATVERKVHRPVQWEVMPWWDEKAK